MESSFQFRSGRADESGVAASRNRRQASHEVGRNAAAGAAEAGRRGGRHRCGNGSPAHGAGLRRRERFPPVLTIANMDLSILSSCAANNRV